MQASTVVMMILVLGVLWGGFVAMLVYSMKAEKRRSLRGSTNGGADDV